MGGKSDYHYTSSVQGQCLPRHTGKTCAGDLWGYIAIEHIDGSMTCVASYETNGRTVQKAFLPHLHSIMIMMIRRHLCQAWTLIFIHYQEIP